jgi:hypothetical protein
MALLMVCSHCLKTACVDGTWRCDRWAQSKDIALTRAEQEHLLRPIQPMPKREAP